MANTHRVHKRPLSYAFGVSSLLALLLAPLAHAQDDNYDDWVRSGIQEYDLGHYREAKSYFERAHAVQPSARTLRGLGMVSFELRAYVVAADYFRAALESPERALTDRMREHVQALLSKAESFIARVTLEVEPGDYGVTVDGHAPHLDAAGHLLLDPGGHELALSAKGHQTVVRKLVAEAGEALTLRIVLPNLAEDSGIEVSAPSVVINTTDPPFSTQRWVALGLGAGGLLGLGLSGVLSLLAVSKDGDSEANCDGNLCNEEGLSQRDSARTLGNVATGSLIAGGVLVGVAAVLFFTDVQQEADTSEDAEAHLVPWVGETVGLSLEGRL